MDKTLSRTRDVIASGAKQSTIRQVEIASAPRFSQ
jgi:hypothetical protein